MGLDGEPVEGAFTWPEVAEATKNAEPHVWDSDLVALIKWRDGGTDHCGEDLVALVWANLSDRNFIERHVPEKHKKAALRFRAMSEEDQEDCVRDVLDEPGDKA